MIDSMTATAAQEGLDFCFDPARSGARMRGRHLGLPWVVVPARSMDDVRP